MADLNPSSVVDFRNSPDFGHIIQTALESAWGTTRGAVGATEYIDDSQKSELAETFIRHYTRDLDTADKALDHLGTVLAHLGQPGAAFDKRTRAREIVASLRLWMHYNNLDRVIRGGDTVPLRLQHTNQSIDQIKELAALGASLHAAWREAWNTRAPVATEGNSHSHSAISDGGDASTPTNEKQPPPLPQRARRILILLCRRDAGSPVTGPGLVTLYKDEWKDDRNFNDEAFRNPVLPQIKQHFTVKSKPRLGYWLPRNSPARRYTFSPD